VYVCVYVCVCVYFLCMRAYVSVWRDTRPHQQADGEIVCLIHFALVLYFHGFTFNGLVAVLSSSYL